MNPARRNRDLPVVIRLESRKAENETSKVISAPLSDVRRRCLIINENLSGTSETISYATEVGPERDGEHTKVARDDMRDGYVV